MDTLDPRGRSFVVVLPDTDRAQRVSDRLASAPTRLDHPSGRPWILGHVTTDRVIASRTGDTALAVVGRSDTTESALSKFASDARTPDQLRTASGRFAGSYLTLGSVHGDLYASGAAMETRRLWSARIDDVLVIADRADILAELGGFDVDPTSLALGLLGTLPHPLGRRSLWANVSPLPGDRYLVVDRHGDRSREGQWWHLPSPELDRKPGAQNLRLALAEAVAARTDDAVACDLSGGLDSTPLCYFAARGPRGVLARTLYNDDPGGGEDLAWARKALDSMPGVHTHLVTSTDDFQDFYEGIDGLTATLDEPTQAATAGPRIVALLADDRNRGIGTHLTGLGGDHILRGVNGWEHTLARTNPLRAWNRARAEHIPNGIGILTTLRELADRRPYSGWLEDTMADAFAGVPAPGVPRFNDWSSPVTLPPWLTDHARSLVREAVDDALESAEPLDPTLAGHTDLYFVRDAARLTRGTAQLGHPLGVGYESPLLDDRVVESTFAVRRDQRDTPLEWKPLMKEAMHGLLPDDYLLRTNKVGGGPQSVRGYARHHPRLLELMNDARLFDTGLVDDAALIDTTSPSSRATPPSHIHQAINTALFLRNRTPHPAHI